MKKLFYQFFCMFSIHLKREKLIIIAINQNNNKPIELYYDICPHCGDGDPRITGEF